MRTERGYLPIETPTPLRGLATSFPSTKIPPDFSPDLHNVVVRDGIVKRRAGGVQLGRRLVGRVLALTEFGELGETPYFVALTSHRQYIYDPATQDWKDLTPGQVSHTITAVNTGAKTFTIAGDQTASFPTGRIFPVIGGANEEVYTVVTAVFGVATVITVSETIPSAVVAGVIVVATDLTTATDGLIDYVHCTDLDEHKLLFTNGSDTPRYWTGEPSTPFAVWNPDFENFETCKTLAVFGESLFLGDVTTTVREPQTVAWSNIGHFDDFETGTSGVQLLYNLKGPIKKMAVLGDRLAIYSYNVVMAATFVGPPAIFAFEVVIPDGTRLASPAGIVSINLGHVYLSEENFYLFDGTRGLRTLGDNIYTHYKGRKNQAKLYEATALNDFSKKTLYLAVPDLAGDSLVYTFYHDPFDLGNAVWSVEKYQDTIRSWGFFVNHDEELTWEDASWEPASMPWSSELGAWAEEGEQLEFPIRSYGTDDGKVVIVTEGVLTDLGATAEQYYDTKDFEVPEVGQSILGRWGEIELEVWGTGTLDVYVSTNEGQGFQPIVAQLELTSQPTAYQIPIDFMSRTLRVHLTSSSDFKFRRAKVWVRPGAPA